MSRCLYKTHEPLQWIKFYLGLSFYLKPLILPKFIMKKKGLNSHAVTISVSTSLLLLIKGSNAVNRCEQQSYEKKKIRKQKKDF
jgi:hypothetical protein